MSDVAPTYNTSTGNFCSFLELCDRGVFFHLEKLVLETSQRIQVAQILRPWWGLSSLLGFSGLLWQMISGGRVWLYLLVFNN